MINTNLNEEKLGKGVYNRLSNVNEEEKLSKINNINLGDSQYDPQLDFDDFRNRAQTIRSSKININKNPFGSKILKNDSIYLDNNLNSSYLNNNLNQSNNSSINNNINNRVNNQINPNRRKTLSHNLYKSVNINQNNNNKI